MIPVERARENSFLYEKQNLVILNSVLIYYTTTHICEKMLIFIFSAKFVFVHALWNKPEGQQMCTFSIPQFFVPVLLVLAEAN